MDTFIKKLKEKYPNKKNGLIAEIKYNKDYMESLLKITKFLNKETKISERVYCILNKINFQSKCLCGKPLKFMKLNKVYYNTCGNEKCVHILRSKNA